MSILGRCNVEMVSHPGFQGLSCSKVAGFEGGLFQKLVKGYIFVLWVTQLEGQLFEQFACETNLKKKGSVNLTLLFIINFFLTWNEGCWVAEFIAADVASKGSVFNLVISSLAQLARCFLLFTTDSTTPDTLSLLSNW